MYAPDHADAERINKMRRLGPNDARVEEACFNLQIASAAAQAYLAWGLQFSTVSRQTEVIRMTDIVLSELDNQRKKTDRLIKELEVPWWHVSIYLHNGKAGEPDFERDYKCATGKEALRRAVDEFDEDIHMISCWPRAGAPTMIHADKNGNVDISRGPVQHFQVVVGSDSEGGEI